MSLRALLSRWFKRPAAETRGIFEAIIFFDSPRSKWKRSRHDWKYEQHPGGLRVVLPSLVPMPEPDEQDILARRSFRNLFSARVWVLTRLKELDTSKIVGEVRSL